MEPIPGVEEKGMQHLLKGFAQKNQANLICSNNIQQVEHNISGQQFGLTLLSQIQPGE